MVNHWSIWVKICPVKLRFAKPQESRALCIKVAQLKRELHIGKQQARVFLRMAKMAKGGYRKSAWVLANLNLTFKYLVGL